MFIRLTTHKDRRSGKGGLSELDVDMAACCDREGREVGGFRDAGDGERNEFAEKGKGLVGKVMDGEAG